MEKLFNDTLILLSNDKLVWLVVWLIIGDIIFGTLRACKYRKFNSSVGIDGMIRKCTMLVALGGTAVIDAMFDINFIGFAEQFLKGISFTHIGICEFFAIFFAIFEALSILKNWTILGIWLPVKFRLAVYEWVKNMTDELPKEFVEEMENILSVNG